MKCADWGILCGIDGMMEPATTGPATRSELRRLADASLGARAGLDTDVKPAGVADDTPMTIGEVAGEFGLTLRALRFYESRRLVSPERQGAVRLYRRRDRERISLILTGRRLGFSLRDIGELVGAPDGAALHLSRRQCVEQINLLERQKRGIEQAIAELRKIYTSFYDALREDGSLRR
jgi:DNA-binding transcriptional MerR regulator